MNGWKKQAARAAMVWCLTYATGVMILLVIRAEHPFVTALLPTLATVYSNIGLIKKAFRSVSTGEQGNNETDQLDTAD